MRTFGIFYTLTLSITLNVVLVQFLSVCYYFMQCVMLDQFPSVHLSVTSNRQMDRQKIIEGDRADGLTIRYTDI